MSDERKANLRTPARAAVVGLLAGLLVWARAPFAPRNFWGEDGARFFSHALEDGWIEPIGRSLAGYYHLLPRLLGPLGTLVPIEWAPAAVFLGGAGAVAWLAASTWLADRSVGRGIAVLALTPILLPITGFESIANVANLHFLMLCATAVVLVGEQDGSGRRVNDGVLAVMTGLSSPTTLGLAPLAAVRFWSDRREGRGTSSVVVCWAVGIGVQLLMVATMAEDVRDMAFDRSLQKSGFLFLERVVSYNLVPFWPRITGEDASSVTAGLVLRALVGLAILAVVGLGLLWAVRGAWRRGDDRRAVLLVAVPATAVCFFAAASLLVGSEPRYAVFPAFCLVWTLLMLVAGRGIGVPVVAMGVVLLLAVVTHWVPSSLRRTGPTWRAGVEVAVEECRADSGSVPEVPIIPDGWTVPLDCRHLDVD